MDIHYYERSVMTRVPIANKSQRVLDDLHRHAWHLFNGTKNERGRPFVFRFDPINDDRFLVTLRSDKPFKDSVERVLSVHEGDSVTVDLASLPLARRTNHQNGKEVQRERVLADDEWPDYMQRLIAKAGLSETETPKLTRLAKYRLKPEMWSRKPVANATVTATIQDINAFASAWLDGVGRSRGYGMGMLRLHPDSPVADGVAA